MDIARRPMGSCSRLAVSKQSMFYIPFLNSLSELLSNKYIYEEVCFKIHLCIMTTISTMNHLEFIYLGAEHSPPY